ncbi:type I restriction enzyme, S subunit [Mucilaginibacter mallensis]|uniref:Type I restriction enzyme, S subunit n=1 Tax=Mucilaginibacter mallensis TaxID=652787 RepID=A0A1H1MAR6_MUCMA|nr:type I restriction enzyme, S subunit [Mucilaginibacter mallensis]
MDIEVLESQNITQFADPYSTVISSINDLFVVWDGSRSGLVFKGMAGAVGSTLMCLTPIGINNTYLYYFLKLQFYYFNQNTTGDSIPHINSDLFYDLEIPFPPMEEQIDIVNLIEEKWVKFENDINKSNSELIQSLRNYLSELNSNLAETELNKIHSLEDFKNSVLDYAVSGKLSNKRSDEYEEYPKIRLGEVLTSINYGTAKPSKKNTDGTAIIRIPNLKNFYIDLSDLKYSHLTEDEYNSLKLEIGDILLIRSNGSVNLLGRSCIITDKEKGLAFAGYLLRLRLNHAKILSEFLNYSLHSPVVRRQIESGGRSSSGVNNINTDEVKNLTIYLPEITEQREIVSNIEKLLVKIEEAEEKNKLTSQLFDNLYQSILNMAFSGGFSSANPIDQSFSTIIRQLEIEKENKLNEIKLLQKAQSTLLNEKFMSSKDHEKVKDFIKKYSVEQYGKSDFILSDEDIRNIKIKTQDSFKDFDSDDFSSIFLEMVQSKVTPTDDLPFFITVKNDEKIGFQIRKS